MPLVMSYDKFHYRRIAKFISPIVNERITAFQKGEVYKNPDKSEPNDYVQWALNYAFADKDPLERTPELIMKRLASLGFATIHSPTVIISNVLFDIMSSPSATYLQQVIRDEVNEVISKHPGKEWTKASLSQMIRIDSMIRESLRLNAFSARAISKKVISPQGIDLPSGEHLPYGVMVGITASGTHYDNSIYPNAETYEPFRFSNSVNITKVDESNGKMDRVSKKPPPMVSTSDDFLAFSHGSHAW
jgi:cytochrome P450